MSLNVDNLYFLKITIKILVFKIIIFVVYIRRMTFGSKHKKLELDSLNVYKQHL